MAPNFKDRFAHRLHNSLRHLRGIHLVTGVDAGHDDIELFENPIGIIEGAVGGYVGGHLALHGHDVTLVDFWHDNVEAIRKNGLELSGMTVRTTDNPEGDMEISVIGLRPGEKLYEELLIGSDPRPTQHERIFQARERFLRIDELKAALQELEGHLSAGDVVAALAQLRRIAPEYCPSGTPPEEAATPNPAASGAHLRVVGRAVVN